jgi:transcriptional regulator with XRE-family HTH domain
MSKRTILPGAVKAIREAKAESDARFRLGQFAVTCLMTPGHLRNIEAGRKPATEDVIHRIAAHLGVTVDAISYATEAAA